jgi:GNAT superfamily N-acetyltransferase
VSPELTKRAWREIAISEEHGDLLGGILEGDDEIREWASNEGVPRKLLDPLKGKRVGVIDQMSAAEHGKGMGTKLMKQFYRRTKSCDALVLRADTEHWQTPGFDLVEWYERQGFQQVGKDSVGFPVMV